MMMHQSSLLAGSHCWWWAVPVLLLLASSSLLLPGATSFAPTTVTTSFIGGGSSSGATTAADGAVVAVGALRLHRFRVIPTGNDGRRRYARTNDALLASAKEEEEGGGDKKDHPNLTNEEVSRYSRHLVLGDVGVAGQRALKNSRVLVIGAGGLGSPCLLYLAAAGIGRIGIVDADTVDTSNLQRQVIHGTSTVGVSKCESARRRILDINPHVDVRTYEEEFTSETAMRILLGGGDGVNGDSEDDDDDDGRSSETTTTTTRWDVVVDGSDNFPTKYLINDSCDIAGVPWVYSAILAFEGQVSTFNYKGGTDYRDLLPSPPPPGDVPSCAEGGVLGVLPGTMGCLQATEVIKILLGKERGLLNGRVLVFDAIAMKFSEIGLVRSPQRERASELIDYQGFCAGPKIAAAAQQQPKETAAAAANDVANTNAPTAGGGRTMDEALVDNVGPKSGEEDDFHSISPAECLTKLAGGWSPWVLDVRLQTENDIVALPFTDAVAPHRTVRPDHVPKEGEVLVYCKAGVRGRKACNRLVELGVDPERLYNLEGGIMRWQKEVDPQMPRY